MKNLSKLMLCCAAVMCAGQMAEASEANAKSPTISVVGSAVLKVEPDLATISFVAEVSEKESDKAREKLDAAISRLASECERLGIAKDRIIAESSNIHPQYSYPEASSKKRPVVTGYRGYRTIEVTVNDFSLIEKIIGFAAKDGTANIRNVSYSLADPHAYAQQVRELAVKDALEKARGLGALLNAKVTKLNSVSYRQNRMLEGEQEAVPMMLRANKGMSNDAFGGDDSSFYSHNKIVLRDEVDVVFDAEASLLKE